MNASLARAAAPLAIVAGTLVVVTRVVVMLTTPTEIGPLKAFVLTATHAINSVLSIVAFALLIVALIAAYDREAGVAGSPGVVGIAAAVVGTVFMAGDWWYEAFAVPRLAEVAPSVIDAFVGGRLLLGGLASFVLFGIGWVLFGLASLRARVFPASISVAIAAGGLLSGIPIGIAYLSGGAVLGLAFVALGVWMTGRSGTTRDVASHSTAS